MDVGWGNESGEAGAATKSVFSDYVEGAWECNGAEAGA